MRKGKGGKGGEEVKVKEKEKGKEEEPRQGKDAKWTVPAEPVWKEVRMEELETLLGEINKRRGQIEAYMKVGGFPLGNAYSLKERDEWKKNKKRETDDTMAGLDEMREKAEKEIALRKVQGATVAGLTVMKEREEREKSKRKEIDEASRETSYNTLNEAKDKLQKTIRVKFDQVREMRGA